MRESGFHNFPATDRVVYGKPAAEALSEKVARLNAKRVFLIASRTLNTKTDEIEKIRRALGDRCVTTLDGIAQHTTRKQAANAAVAARNAKADLIVAIGGGSAIDLAKIVIMAMECQSASNFDPSYCLICECYPDGALAAVDPMSTERPRQLTFQACSVGGAVGGSGPT
jgi:maleylacetate reductase